MRTFILILSVTLLSLALGPITKASEFDKKTILTFSEPVQIPGAVLGAGTYVVKRADPGGNPDVVRFLSSDEMHVYATVLAIPSERGTPPNKPEVTFAETRGGTPQAIKKWWYPGETTGEEFVYPKGGPVLIARANISEMPSRRTEVAPPPQAPEPQTSSISPEISEPAPEQPQDNGPVETAQNTPPPEPPSAPPSAPQTLPKTASDIPLLALLGGLSCLCGVGLNALSRKKA